MVASFNKVPGSLEGLDASGWPLTDEYTENQLAILYGRLVADRSEIEHRVVQSETPRRTPRVYGGIIVSNEDADVPRTDSL